MSIRVLVVDDSAFVRRAVKRMLGSDPSIEVVGEANDGLEALAKLKVLKPDVVTLDLRMPKLDGLATLKLIMRDQPTPVVLLSSFSSSDATLTMDALAAGAIDFIDKSTVRSIDLHSLGDELRTKIRAASRSRLRPQSVPAPPTSSRSPEGGLAVARVLRSSPRPKVVVIGASTGGPPAIQQILSGLGASFPVPILIIQHMPFGFTKEFAKRLDRECSLTVKEAQSGDPMLPGQALVGCAGSDLRLRPGRQGVEVELREGSSEALHAPSVDAALTSAAQCYGSGTCGVVLTGMGRDGLAGAHAVREVGGTLIAQDEASCVVFGMPKAIASAGLSDCLVDLDNIADLLVRMLK